MLPQCSHITRKRGCYYYRRRLPKPFTGEIALSLRTRAFREAEWLADQLDNAFVRVLRNMTETTESRADIAAIATKHLRESLEFDLKIRQARATRPPLSDWEKWSTSIYAVDEELDKAKAELAGRGHPERHDDYIDWFAEQNNVPADQRNELAFAILRANVAKWEIIRRRTLGDPAAFEEARVVEASPVTAGPTALAVPKGPLFLEVLPGFIEYMQQTEGWRGQTLAQNKTTYRMFVECCGDRPVNEYQRIDFAKFYDVLRALPKLYAKSQEWRGLPLAEIAAQTKERELPRLSIRTVKRHSTAMGRLFSNLKKRGEITGENPAHGHDFPKKGRTRSGRSMWSGEMLKKLFASPVWTGCLSEARRSLPGERIIKDEKYWLPLLGVYHGNRLEEFAQLRRSDVRQENDIWFLDINDEGNKQVKNEQSKRRVPQVRDECGNDCVKALLIFWPAFALSEAVVMLQHLQLTRYLADYLLCALCRWKPVRIEPRIRRSFVIEVLCRGHFDGNRFHARQRGFLIFVHLGLIRSVLTRAQVWRCGSSVTR